jgi:hypothetical protein
MCYCFACCISTEMELYICDQYMRHLLRHILFRNDVSLNLLAPCGSLYQLNHIELLGCLVDVSQSGKKKVLACEISNSYSSKYGGDSFLGCSAVTVRHYIPEKCYYLSGFVFIAVLCKY